MVSFRNYGARKCSRAGRREGGKDTREYQCNRRTTQRLEERVERVQRRTEKDREGEERESRAAFADKFKRGIEQASE